MTRNAETAARAALAEAIDQAACYDDMDDALDSCVENAIEDRDDWREIVAIFNRLAREAGLR